MAFPDPTYGLRCQACSLRQVWQRPKAALWTMVAGCWVLALAARAHAQTPFTEHRMQLGGGLDYGLYLNNMGEDIPTPYGLGFNARAGYTLKPNLYLGGELNYFLGATQRFPEYGDVEGSLSVLHYGAEVGYDVGLGPSFALRPKLGLGSATVAATVTVEDMRGDVSETGLAITGGAQALLGGHTLFFAAEARYTYLRVSTAPLQDIPGIAVSDDAQLDGLLFAVGAGAAF
jgi:hypothetical protein